MKLIQFHLKVINNYWFFLNINLEVYPCDFLNNNSSQILPDPKDFAKKLTEKLHNVYEYWAHFVVKYKFLIIFICLSTTIICAYKVLTTK